MTDRELLELAAQAAGYTLEEHFDANGLYWPWCIEIGDYWCPLTDDGDALRLAVKLQLTVCNEHLSAGVAYCTQGIDRSFAEIRSGVKSDIEVIPEDYAATRRAIVRAAAEIAKATEVRK